MDLLSQMRTFARVVESGSLSRAARALRLSPAAVSRQVSALEEDLGTRLLLKTTRRLTVTDAGRRYHTHCLRVLRGVEDARASVARDGAVSGLLTVTAPIAFGLARVAPCLAGLLARHPALRVDLRLEDRVVDLVGEGIDVAIRSGMPPPDSTSVVAQVVATYERVLVASPAYLERRGEPKTPDALASHQALVHLPGDGRPSSWSFRRGDREQVALVTAAFRTNAFLALHEAARSGLGIALLPAWLVEADLEAGRLAALLREWHTPRVSVSAIYRTELRGSPRIRAFLEQLDGRAAGARARRATPEAGPART